MQRKSKLYSFCKPRNQLFFVILLSLTIILFYVMSDSLSYSVSVVHSVLIRESGGRSFWFPTRNELDNKTSRSNANTKTTETISTTITTTEAVSTTTTLPFLHDVFNLSAPARLSFDFPAINSTEGNETVFFPSQLCAYPPPNLVGRFEPNKAVPSSMDEIISQYSDVKAGGAWEPADCVPRWRVAIIVPFRNRDVHLRVFLNVYHAFLQKQQIGYRIFVIDQSDKTAFNRAMLFNIGFLEALRTVEPHFSLAQLAELADFFMSDRLSWAASGNVSTDNYINTNFNVSAIEYTRLEAANRLVGRILRTFQCFVFHDVDLLPEDDRNIYSCPVGDPRHLSVAIDKFKYELLYPALFGGASSIRLGQFLKVNGFSNSYFDWGGEDDDFAARVTRYWRIERFPNEVARYTMLTGKEHSSAKQNPKRWQLLKDAKGRFATDGLNSLSGRFRLLDRREEPLYTHVRVHIYAPDQRSGSRATFQRSTYTCYVPLIATSVIIYSRIKRNYVF